MIRYEEWINRARSSLNLSKFAANTVVNNQVYYEDLCYQTQQAVEKAIKGLLIYYGVEPEFTHNIGKLLGELERYSTIPTNIRLSAELTNYAIFTKYPGEYEAITKEEYEKAVHIAQDCLDWVENKIKDTGKEKRQ